MKKAYFYLCLMLFCLLLPLHSQDYLSRVQVSNEEVETELNRFIIQKQLQDKDYNKEEREQLREDVKDGIIMRKLLLSLAAYREVKLSEKEVDQLESQARGDYPDEEWDTLLKSQLYTRESFRQVLKETRIIDLILKQEVWDGITVSDEEIQAFYEDQEAQFTSDYGLIPLEDVKDLIKNTIKSRKSQEATSLFMDNLFSQAMFVEKDE
jgi:hypothetical protein